MAPSTSEIELKILVGDESGGPDRMTKVADEVKVLSALQEMFQSIVHAKTPKATPSSLGFACKSTWDDALKYVDFLVGRAKLFLCIASAWDMMLDANLVSRQQRKVDVENLRKTVAANSVSTFPDKIMQLLTKWVDGADIPALLP